MCQDALKKKRKMSLVDALCDIREESTFDSPPRAYYPRAKMRGLVTNESICEELALDTANPDEFDKYSREDFVDYIVREAWITFLILVTVHCSNAPDDCRFMLMEGRGSGHSDAKLPFKSRQTLPFSAGDHVSEMIFREQWMFLAPVFRPERYYYDLDERCILPINKIPGPIKSGVFSSVYKLKIHPDYHDYDDLGEVAVREIYLNRSDSRAMTGTDHEWETEAKTQEIVRLINHPRIIKCLAAISHGPRRYFMLEWANGDSLRHFWQQSPLHTPNEHLVKDAIIQLRGLADALKSLHYFETPATCSEEDKRSSLLPDLHIRHGDLKPENILRFMSKEESNSDIGTLKLANIGHAKQHIAQTDGCVDTVSTKYRTVRYEAPESSLEGPRSRIYDIWSMGCITLEFIIWILYGNNSIKVFHDECRGLSIHPEKLFQFDQDGGSLTVKQHSVVVRWILHIKATVRSPSLGQDSAILDLLDLVQTKLLRINLRLILTDTLEDMHLSPFSESEIVATGRATARDFFEAMDTMMKKITAKQPGYCEIAGTLCPPTNLSDPSESYRLLPPVTAHRGHISNQAPVWLGQWEFHVDNRFTAKVLARLGFEHFVPRRVREMTLCDRCRELNFWASGFSLQCQAPELESRRSTCVFCDALFEAWTAQEILNGPEVSLKRQDSALIAAEGHSLPALSIVRSPECHPPCPVQLGFPELPQPGSPAFFSIIKLWLEDCENDTVYHKECTGFPPTRLPTRLIDVENSSGLRLVDTQEAQIESSKYIALSHPWGDPAKHPPFSTLQHDNSGRGRTLANFKRCIPYDELPCTFRDAIRTTRALGIRYLWIDSICIVQGKDGDFNEESKRMEDVFSGAYCVLAASRAMGQGDGFLGTRTQRKFIEFQRGGEKPFYICEPLDKFEDHVINGSLNRRGWVLQERALARRIIYFTEWQTYFECGNGIRCETLGNMRNELASFLGDPKFPERAMKKNRGFKIMYFKELYRQYSRLEFTKVEDRPVAIAGLEKRLQKAYNTKGGFGIFHGGTIVELFHHSLLWQRGADETSLTPIVFPVERNIKVPSWSWMAYKGGIDYVDADFQDVNWGANEIWPSERIVHPDLAREDTDMALKGTIRDFKVAGRKKNEVALAYDNTERTKTDGNQRPQCVVVAKSITGRSDQQKRHYVLLVTATKKTTAKGVKIYNRVGAGFMLGKYISLEKPGVEVEIC